MSDAQVRGIVVAHAALARGLVEAVQRIAGMDDDALVPFSNEGLGPEGIRDGVARLAGDGPVIVFTDLREGSCGIAARRACRDSGSCAVITGVNLPLLLDFAMKRSSLPLEELVPRLIQRGRDGICAIPEPG